ncbi:hypothetical protein [Aquisphaera insulae]|uniref:hypothetical protein n=1 Tax=Aquisphaera insulae TaxID=2712864 RepID=UPI0013EC63BD|nr:hypothetical protein [Aquisphaera insulae]
MNAPRGDGDRLAFFVTSHGFGHLNRAVAAINKVPAKIPVVIRSHPDLFPHWNERLTRPAELSAHVSDSGAINPPGDSTATDGPATLAAAARIHEEAMGRLDADARWLTDHGIAAILCDAPAMPLLAARHAGVPGACLVNFTWADIYGPYAKAAGRHALELVAAIRTAYRSATRVFRCEPALAMSWLPRQENVGIVANPARDRRRELRSLLGLGPREKLAYFYVGRYGQDGLDWERLERFGDRGIHFVGYHAAPVGPLKNLHVIPAHDWRGSDLIFATDALVAKAGYGTVSEAMAYGRPMIYPPRTGFSEFRALDRALRAWGGGIPVSSRDFSGFRLEQALDRAFATGPLRPPYPTDGADRVAGELAALCRPSAAVRASRRA